MGGPEEVVGLVGHSREMWPASPQEWHFQVEFHLLGGVVGGARPEETYLLSLGMTARMVVKSSGWNGLAGCRAGGGVDGLQERAEGDLGDGMKKMGEGGLEEIGELEFEEEVE